MNLRVFYLTRRGLSDGYKKPRTGGESCTGLYFWKWVVRHLVTMDHYFFRLNEEMMG